MDLIAEAALGCALLGGLSGFLGNFLIVRKMALLGDMIGHAVLPGVAIGFFVAAFEKRMLYIFLGAMAAALAANFLHEFFSNRLRIKADASLAINLTGFYALGSTMLAWLKDSGRANQSGLDRYLLGQASSLSSADLQFISILSVLVVLITLLFFKEFKAACFDYEFSKSASLKPRLHLSLLSALIAATVIVSLQAVGVILACAFLIIPAASAVFFSHRLSSRLILGAIFGSIAGGLGAFISVSFANVPTGPAIILVSALFFVIGGLFGPKQGKLLELYTRWRDARASQDEDFLRSAYYFWEQAPNEEILLDGVYKRSDRDKKPFFKKTLRRLRSKKIVIAANTKDRISLSPEGLALAAAMVRKHRLWEVYLVTKMGFPPERVHRSAEQVEHLITPEIMAKLEETLSTTTMDPHGRRIPSIKELKKHGVPGY